MYKTLDRNELFQGFTVPDWATAAAFFKGHWYFEESLEQLDGGRFEKAGSGCTRKYGGGALKGFEKAMLFTPLVEQDDPLPPAPESALHNALSDGGCNLEVAMLAANEYYDGRIRISVRNNQGAKQGKVTCLTPDAALQLAHDLNRMANEIKRRERAQSGE